MDEQYEKYESPIIDNELDKLVISPFNDLEIDWQEYFKQFCKVHGSYPVIFTDEDGTELLLFPDGWMYSSTQYEGPEIKPPESKVELVNLRLYYWKRRHTIVSKDYDTTKFNLEQLMNIARSRSLPLYQRIQSVDDEGRVKTSSSKLDTMMIQKRLQWLKQDIDNCKMQIHMLIRERDKLLSLSGIS